MYLCCDSFQLRCQVSYNVFKSVQGDALFLCGCKNTNHVTGLSMYELSLKTAVILKREFWADLAN